ncbi:uncharacterized protein LOC110368330 [Fundulus heteroclitus]|uniref:uncharacterized protein LOC110368330 n=1 Tax=Fundulus heteroclitus TaxID=8078 RepID=UPI00165AA8FF|nr:uncharacterized protein LOC110368330 [Fundulus heteroclitus]
MRSSGIAAFSRTEDFNQPITVCGHAHTQSCPVFTCETQYLKMPQLNKPDENIETEDNQENGSRPEEEFETEENQTNSSKPEEEFQTEENQTNISKPEEEFETKDNQEEHTLEGNSEVDSYVTGSTPKCQMPTPSSGSGYISEIKVSLNKQDERKLLHGYQKIDVNLNKGAGGEEVYIWYKRSYSSALITRIQLSFKEEMWKGLKEAYYTKVDGNLNQGAEGNTINLWFYKGRSEYDVPIEDISITTSPEEEEKMFESSWERLACNLNRRAGGNNIHLWVKRSRPTYICDLAATEGFDKDAEMFNKGYIRVDEDTNRGTRGDYVFIWYRLTTSRDTAIRDMQVSITKEEYEGFTKAGYKLVDQDLNQKTTGTPVYLWYRKDQPITNFSLMVKETDLEKYKNVIQFIKKNLNEGNDGCTEYLWYYRKEEPLTRRAITDIAVSFNEEEERDLLLQGFIAVPHSLHNDERGNQVYLWYKIGTEKPITYIRFSYNPCETYSLQIQKFQKYEKNLNLASCGEPIYLLYYRGTDSPPLVELDVFDCPQNKFKMLSFGWSSLDTSPYNRFAGPKKDIYGRTEKPTYISDIRFSAGSEIKKLIRRWLHSRK